DRVSPTPRAPAPAAEPAIVIVDKPVPASGPTQPSGPVAAADFDPTQIRVGVTTTLRAEPQHLSLDQIKTHVAFLGGTGSGKTTAALNVIEQLLERGVSALLLDRKGDL